MIGRTLGHYRIVDKLSGGMGDVPATRREVALKILRSGVMEG
jgi:hypothetical protein